MNNNSAVLCRACHWKFVENSLEIKLEIHCDWKFTRDFGFEDDTVIGNRDRAAKRLKALEVFALSDMFCTLTGSRFPDSMLEISIILLYG